MRTSPPRMRARRSASSKGSGAPAKTGTPSISMRRRSGSSSTAWPARPRASVGGEAGRLQDRRQRQAGVAGRARDASPVGIGAVDGGLDEVAADDGARHGPRVGVVAGAAHRAGDERRGTLAVGGLLARQRAGHGLQGAGEDRRWPPCPASRGSAPGGTGCRQQHGVVGGLVAVHAELVPGARHDGPQERLEQLRRGGRVGEHEAEHRGHVGVDHAHALGHAADGDGHGDTVRPGQRPRGRRPPWPANRSCAGPPRRPRRRRRPRAARRPRRCRWRPRRARRAGGCR